MSSLPFPSVLIVSPRLTNWTTIIYIIDFSTQILTWNNAFFPERFVNVSFWGLHGFNFFFLNNNNIVYNKILTHNSLPSPKSRVIFYFFFWFIIHILIIFIPLSVCFEFRENFGHLFVNAVCNSLHYDTHYLMLLILVFDIFFNFFFANRSQGFFLALY